MAANQSAAPELSGHNLPKARNPYAEAFRSLQGNKAAMVGLFVLLLLILCAVFADYIAPFPYDLQNMNVRRYKQK